jgi:hypothetical protein
MDEAAGSAARPRLTLERTAALEVRFRVAGTNAPPAFANLRAVWQDSVARFRRKKFMTSHP